MNYYELLFPFQNYYGEKFRSVSRRRKGYGDRNQGERYQTGPSASNPGVSFSRRNFLRDLENAIIVLTFK